VDEHKHDIASMIEGLGDIDWGLPASRRWAARRLVKMGEKGGRGSNQGAPKTRNPFTIKALSTSGVTWKCHFLNHALFLMTAAAGMDRDDDASVARLIAKMTGLDLPRTTKKK